MSKTINQHSGRTSDLFRVWPDSTVQHVDEPRHTHRSDDYVFVWAQNEDDALSIAINEGYV